MPEFVYALHDFEPEHDDEIAFRAGERIEVVEKDDLYGDGWWQGRNLVGKVGLFPQSYTAAVASSPESTHAAPSALSDAATSSIHQTSNNTTATVITDTTNLKSADADYQNDTTVIAPVLHAPLDFASLANGHPNGTDSAADGGGLTRSTDQAALPNPANVTQTDGDGDGDGEVMRATMTDVQHAIEQLGGGDRGRAEDGDTRSFSFASSHDERDTDRETDTDMDAFDLSDVEGREGGGANAEGAGEGWHKGARRKLAEKARRAVEEAEKLEAMMGSMGSSAGDRTRERGGTRVVAPPIEVELSDESDAEENDFVTRSGPRTHPFIPEEDEEEEAPAAKARVQEERFIKRGSSSSVQSTQSVNLVIPERDEYEVKTATVTKSSFAVQPTPEVPLVENEFSIRTIQPLSNASTSAASSLSPPSPPSETLSNPFASPPGMYVSPSITATGTTTATSPEMPRVGTPMRESLAALPSPTTSFAGSVPGGQVQSRHDSRASASPARESDFGGGGAGARGSGSVAGQAPSQQNTLVEERREGEKEKAHPSEWTVEDVVEWLRGKGFDQEVCAKFIEQEITGDVLLELDVNLLKSEIGITAFGKRVRIANAITELRRPPSVAYSDHQHSHTHQQQQYPGFSPEQLSPASPIMLQAQAQVQTAARSASPHPALAHSRTQSLAQSHHSYPGASIGTGASVSASTGTGTAPSTGVSSFGSPFAYAQAQGPPQPGQGYVPGAYGQAGYAQMNGVTVLATGPIVLESSSQEHYGSAVVGADAGATVGEVPQPGQLGGIGLGIGMPPVNGKGIKLRPAHLSLSPSDGALKASANKAVARAQAEGETDRGHFSDGEAAPMSMRQRLFGRSHESTSTKTESPATSRHSKEDEVSPSIPTPPTSRDDDKDKDKDSSSVATSRHARSKKSVDGGSKGGERLSIFGASFGGSLGKHRKPPPRYSGIGEDVASEKSSSMFTLPRLHGPSNRKSSSGRPSSSHGSSSGAAGALAALRPSTAREREHKVDKQKVSAPLAVVKEKEPRDVAVLRKRTSSAPGPAPTPSVRTPSSDSVMTNGIGNGSVSVSVGGVPGPLKQGESILDQIGEPDHSGWMRKKGDRYNSWKLRYFVLKGPHLYYLKSSSRSETKIKGYINIVGYKVTVDENSNPGRYAFRIEHDNDKTHFFSSDEKMVLREWMKAIMKATIGRDYTKPVISSCNIPTIPLTVAQAMNPAPRPPSPSARDATQKALRRENPNQLSSRDARILMGLPSNADGQEERPRLDSFFANESVDGAAQPKSAVPPRPSRELRRVSTPKNNYVPVEESLIEWANSHLPHQLRITDSTSSLYSGLGLLRIAESIRGFPSSPPVPDSDFPLHPNDDKLDGLFKLFDFLLDNDVKMGSVSINDIRQGKRDKVIQLLRALKSWEDKRRVIAHSFGATSVHAGSFVAPNIW